MERRWNSGGSRRAWRMALAGLAAAAAVLMTPVGLIELVVASSGFSEAVPAAAPPLGWTARLMAALFAAMMGAGLAAMTARDRGTVVAPKDEERHGDHARGVRSMGFAFSKLAAFARGRVAPTGDRDAPALRRADAHPDAPARPPIFASRDFGGADIFARPESGRRSLVSQAEPEPRSILPSPNFAMPSAPLPFAEEELPTPSFRRFDGAGARPASLTPAHIEDVPEDAPAAAPFAAPFAAPVEDMAAPDALASPEPVPAAPPVEPEEARNDETVDACDVEIASETDVAAEPLRAGMSIGELTERLERGLAARRRAGPVRVLADMPVAAPVPVRDAVAPDADAALREALGALRSIAGRAH
ncbi:hypothetical protein J3E64_000581 [Sphingobium sp. OAS761]|uniref:hypothetical protein n=1 Tax=Sphingobium sp. OAS761 TaxID=2817901 RepID=UPI00209D3260|nr:hypothetical protein [Sphingobium sp. OAS761]MCP1468910.1 hypothetical protein [Sphingobium sp. OAS761]